jgi:hypothetical protein
VPLSTNLTRWSRTIATGGLCALFALSAHAAPVSTSAKYVVSLGGVNIAKAVIDFNDNGSNYAVDIDADVSGVGSLVASGSAMLESSGNSRGNALAAQGFNFSTRTRAEQFNVDVEYASGNATGFKIEPPLMNHVNRVALERKHLKGVSDPIGAFILKGDALDASLCNRRLKVFTGIERYDIAMSYAASQTATSNRTGYQGPVVLCKMRYIPVSGHFTSSEVTNYLANSDRILVWYAPLKNSGYFIPYRVLLGTTAGDLSMVLTGLN